MLLAERIRRASARLGDEEGSMVIALLAVIVASGLMLSITASAVAGHRHVRQDSNHVRAVQGADAGVEEAVYRFSSNDPAVQLTGATPLTPAASQPAITTSGGGSYRYEVVDADPVGSPVDSGDWLVKSYSTLNGVQRQVSAVIGRPNPFWFAAFADTNMTLRGGNSANSYNPAQGWGGLQQGIVGSNGKITLNGNVVADDAKIHDWLANPDSTRCTSNGNAVCGGVDYDDNKADVSSPEAMAFIDEALTTPTANCPATPVAFTGSTLAASPVPYCFTTMTITSNFTVTGTGNAIVYLKGDPVTPVNPTFSVGNKLYVNCTSCTGTGGAVQPLAEKLQIFTKSTGGIRIGNHSHVAASIYAPKATCGGNPSNAGAHFYGSMVCEVVTNQGAWSFHYDERLRNLGVGGWYVKKWAEE